MKPTITSVLDINGGSYKTSVRDLPDATDLAQAPRKIDRIGLAAPNLTVQRFGRGFE